MTRTSLGRSFAPHQRVRGGVRRSAVVDASFVERIEAQIAHERERTAPPPGLPPLPDLPDPLTAWVDR